MNGIDNIYCIHLKDRTDRKISIDKTAKHHNLNITFIDAVTPDDPEVAKRLKTKNIATDCMKKEYACVLSHLKAIQKIIDNKDEISIIIEDDVQFIENIETRIGDLLDICKNNKYNIIHLSPFISDYDGMEWVYNSDDYEIITTNKQTWSAAGYLVSKEGAFEVIKNMDNLFETLDYVTAETFIIQQENVCLCKPPFVVESCETPSSIQPPESNDYHIRYWNFFRKDHKYI